MPQPKAPTGRSRRPPEPHASTAQGASRDRVLALLQETGESLSASEVAETVGLHPNTARFHLDGLVALGRVQREVENRDRPGRPRTLFTAVPGQEPAGQRSYKMLAEILTGGWAEHVERPADAAAAAGEAWGRYLAEPLPPYRHTSVEEAVDGVVDRLDGVGFRSHAVDEGDTVRIEVTHCPFLEAAREHADVVCSVHRGLIAGVLSESRSGVTLEDLEPFVEPRLCVAHLRKQPPASPARRSSRPRRAAGGRGKVS